MTMAIAAARMASPTTSPPINRVVNGNVAAASVTRTVLALGNVAEKGVGLGVAPGETLGKRPPTPVALGCGKRTDGVVLLPGRTWGSTPIGRVVPTPVVTPNPGGRTTDVGEAGDVPDGW